MQKIVYYVAASIDGYIEGPGGDISGFVSAGSGLDKYLSDLKSFDTVIMGRKTYEFGYQYGLKPGHKAYEHMEHYIFSKSIVLPDVQEGVHVCEWSVDKVREIKSLAETDIYLCGGGIFAGWCLQNQLIDEVKIKHSPVIYGDGVRLFGNTDLKLSLEVLSREDHDYGMQIVTYRVQY